jgi:glycosyltransferase involved in cell wall biosynthesis
MRILMSTWEYPPDVVGGLGKHVADLAPALVWRGMEVHVVTPGRRGAPSTDAKDGLIVHRVEPPAGDESLAFVDRALAVNDALDQSATDIVQRWGPFDLIHNHDWLTAPAACAVKHRHKLPLVATVHATERGRGRGYLGNEQAQQINAIEWTLTYEAWRVICCAHYMADEIHSYFDTPFDKIDVIPNGVDPSQFDALEGVDLSAFRAQYALPHERIVFFVGRIVAEKGADVLIRAAPLVLREFPDATFVLAGRGPELRRLRELAETLGLGSKITFAGFISDEDRNRLFRVADCAVFPSLYEPFGIVALEAMAANVPVVVSQVGGLKEVVQHAETGITIYPGNPASCAWGILHTLQHPHWASRRVENARRVVRSIYSWETIAAQTEVVYRRVVEERVRTAW